MKQPNHHIEHRILNAAERLKVPEGQTKEEAWKKVNPIAKVSFLWAYQVAASLAILFVASLVFLVVTQKEVENLTTQPLTVILPDDSEVILNALSKVEYHPYRWIFIREVELEGEGFFKVKKGSKFTVTTELGEVEVLGTSFNVQLREGVLNVACATGKVRVSNITNSRMLLPQQQLTVNTKEVGEVFPIESSQIGSWQKGEFYFVNEPIQHVLAEIERQFNLPIEHQLEDNLNYTGYFDKSNLTEALQMVCLPLNLDFKIEKSKILIKQFEK